MIRPTVLASDSRGSLWKTCWCPLHLVDIKLSLVDEAKNNWKWLWIQMEYVTGDLFFCQTRLYIIIMYAYEINCCWCCQLGCSLGRSLYGPESYLRCLPVWDVAMATLLCRVHHYPSLPLFPFPSFPPPTVTVDKDSICYLISKPRNEGLNYMHMIYDIICTV